MHRHHPPLLRALTLGAFAAVLAAGAAPARADSEESAPVFAVQNRQFNLRNELHVGVGVLPINAFTKGLTVGGGYTFHFSSMWAWEIAQFQYAFGLNTSLRQELLEIVPNGQNGVQPTKLEWIRYFGSSSLLLKPAYGKFSLGNKYVVHVEGYLALGPAVGAFAPRDYMVFGFTGGGGLRFFLSEHWSVRVDLRDVTLFNGDAKNGAVGKPTSELYLGLAIALTLGGGKK
jgi:outer membrane beta-barrel protein